MGGAAFFLTALFRATAAAVLALGGARLAGFALPGSDAVLLVGTGGTALAALLLRSTLRRVDPAGGGAALGWLAVAVALLSCVQRTGGLESPLLLLLAGLVAVASSGLGPLWNLVFLAGVAFAQVLGALGAGTAARPGPLLLVETGLLAVLGHTANRLAGRVRELEEEGRALHDPETGLLRSPLFLARVVALLEARRGPHGVAVVLVDPGPGRDLAEAAARLQGAAREDDLVGRVRGGGLGVASCCPCEAAPEIARRLVRALGGDARAGWAHAGPAVADALGAARRMLDEAAARLEAERVGFAA